MAKSRYIRNPDVVLREEDPDGALLFHPDTRQTEVLNLTGSFIWQLCDGSRDQAAIAMALREAFEDVPEDQVAGDVAEFLERGIATGFIVGLED
jgi:hypothetical protein